MRSAAGTAIAAYPKPGGSGASISTSTVGPLRPSGQTSTFGPSRAVVSGRPRAFTANSGLAPPPVRSVSIGSPSSPVALRHSSTFHTPRNSHPSALPPTMIGIDVAAGAAGNVVVVVETAVVVVPASIVVVGADVVVVVVVAAVVVVVAATGIVSVGRGVEDSWVERAASPTATTTSPSARRLTATPTAAVHPARARGAGRPRRCVRGAARTGWAAHRTSRAFDGGRPRAGRCPSGSGPPVPVG